LLLCSWAGHRRAAEAFAIIVSALNEQPERPLYSPCPIFFS
jgi:hypothetical protein